MKILFTNTWENITLEHKANWKAAYPALHIDQELAKMQAWLLANPKNQKSNYERFIVNWLTNNQDKAPKVGTQEHGLKMLEKAKEMFKETVVRLENNMKVRESTKDELKAFVLGKYPEASDLIAKLRRDFRLSDVIHTKTGLAYQRWVKQWQIGCELFGKETMKELWKKDDSFIDNNNNNSTKDV